MTTQYRIRKHTSEDLLYALNSASVTLQDLTLSIYTPEGQVRLIEAPKLVVELFSLDEIKRYINLTTDNLQAKVEIEEAIVRDKVIDIIGREDCRIAIDFCPAGTITTIVNAIMARSYAFLHNPEHEYTIQESSVTIVEQMAAIVANFLHMPFNEVVALPINEVFKLHSIARLTFPDRINDFRQVEEDLEVSGDGD